MPAKSPKTPSLSAVTNIPVRLDPPETLSAEEKETWRAVASTKPVDWFQADSAPLLVEYCRAKVMCDRLSEMLLCTDENKIGDFKSLLDMRDKESRRLATIACKLRLTQQSRYTPQSAATAAKPGSAANVWSFGK